jgi:uncharacterized protein (TIGR02453 family)
MKFTSIIVEDLNSAAVLLQRHCERSGIIDVLGHFTSAEEALHFLMANPVDLIFLDVEMPGKSGFEFLDLLTKNNNRDWFTENKKRFETENNLAKAFFTEVFTDLEKIDSLEKMQVFRIYRDVRFSKDKLPYKNHFSVGFSRTKPMLRGGMYLHIENEASFVGGGFWAPNNEDLLRIRKEIEQDASDLREIITDPIFKKMFGTLEG